MCSVLWGLGFKQIESSGRLGYHVEEDKKSNGWRRTRMKTIRHTEQTSDFLALPDNDPEKISVLLNQGDCVFIVRNDDVDRVMEMDMDVNDHGWKHEAKGLSTYLLKAEQRPQALRTRYTSEKRLLGQGIEPLLRKASAQGCTAPFLIGIPEALFGDLYQGGVLDEEDGKTSFVELLRDVPSPLGINLEERFRGMSEAARLVRKLIPVAAQNDAPVLLQGATGTGKDIVARSIHDCGNVAGQFIAVNCGAIPADLFESELFGYAPGAFTGALSQGKTGLWETAQSGTLFLDEIAELPKDCQAKVLRVLQSGTMRKVGSARESRVDARVIAASCQDLARLVETGRFREDLFYRLRRFVIRTPSLEDEVENLPDIIDSLWCKLTEGSQRRLSRSAVDLLTTQRWLGSYRELKNFLRLLRDNFDATNISTRHVNAILEYYGASPVPRSRMTSKS
jgi:hypothetical protein